MTQFEFDQLSILANAWTLLAATKSEPEAAQLGRCAEELRQWLRHADTTPGEAVEGEPAILPPIPRNDPLPKIEGA